MKLRISNEVDFAIPFVACSEPEFRRLIHSAARTYRQHQHRYVHRGDIHETVIHSRPGYLHIYDETYETWFNPGKIKTSHLSKLTYFEPQHVQCLPFRETDTLDQCLLQDEFSLAGTAPQLWKWCQDTYTWTMGLRNLTSEVAHSLWSPDAYTTAAAAEQARVSESTITKACRDGTIRAHKVKGMWAIDGNSLDRWIANREITD